ncbi:MAG: polysaccharide pyruvyl transferase family protein [Candidatus Bathyarchaeia archaeon]
MTRSLKVLIANAAGYGNLGDDSIRDALVDAIRQLYPTVEVICTHPPPEKKLVEKADLIIVGGGGLLYDSDFANVEYYMRYLEWAQELKKPNVVIGVGVQGISTERGKKYYQRVLNRVDLITTRDRESREILMNNVGVSAPIHICADLAFLLKQPPRSRDCKPDGNKPMLGVCIRDFHPDFPPRGRYIGSIHEALKLIGTEFKLAFLTFSRDDYELNMRLHSEFRNSSFFFYNYDEGWTVQGFLSLISQCDLTLCTRYHSFIFSISSEVPALPIIELGGKIRWLTYLINHEYYSCLMDSIATDEVLEKIYDIWDNREVIKANFAEWRKELHRRAYRNVELLDSIITGGD